uniref:Uncharacterized protein n=1 Tax=Alexandrium andersonii TaxID=327968 RepID=A0A7S2GAP0_9DINO|mmetsp:Transcript_45756/g.103870  ORF Transcript_45756/g.103870 Transcript_45756/m.103870 type:complete len:314 (+) Transcript_45756:87-1028(+)
MSGLTSRLILVAGASCVAAIRRAQVDLTAVVHSPPPEAALLQTEGLPDCRTVAPDTYPGLCDPAASGYACYSTEQRYSPPGVPSVAIDVQWACSIGQNAEGFTAESCKSIPWEFNGLDPNGAHQVFTANDIYKGACKFGDDEPPVGQDEAAEETDVSPSTAAGHNESSETEDATPRFDKLLDMLTGRWVVADPQKKMQIRSGASTDEKRSIVFSNEVTTARGREWDFSFYKSSKQKAYASFFANQCEKTFPYKCRIGQHPKLLEYVSGGLFGGTNAFKLYFRYLAPGQIEVFEGELCAYNKPCLAGWTSFTRR